MGSRVTPGAFLFCKGAQNMQKHQRRFPGGSFGQGRPARVLHYPTKSRVYQVFGARVFHEFDDYNNHRITVDGRQSDWAAFDYPAKLRMGTGWMAATTDRWIGIFPRCFLYIDT
jgi:hypothetical protein